MRDDVVDYAVIGGGSSGSIVASRLSEAGANVLLLEAGGSDRRLDVLIPAGVASAYAKANWKYPAEPDPSRTGSPEAWMAGKVMGGSGSINSCVFVRGNRSDYDGWAKLGCPGWDYASVLSAFKRLETWERGADEFRGGSGPISVTTQTNRGEANTAYYEAARQAGFPRTADYNGPVQDGISWVQVNHRRGTRSSSSREYLRRVADKNHIIVRTKAMVHRILIEGGRAVGVEYRHDGQTKRVRVRDEVILAAGALASPKILMLSGVGPKDALGDVGIEVIHHSPGVGRNLNEHAYLMQRWNSKIPTINKMRAGTILGAFKDYLWKGTGLLAMTMVQVQVMTRTDPALESPDVQLQFVPFAITRDVDENGMFNVQPAKTEGFLSSSTFLHPRYRGRITLRSADPEAPPRIEHQLLGHPDDLRDTVRGLQLVHRIMEQPALAEITDGQFEPERNCRADADWEQYARSYATPSYHPVGTCKMGVDDESVVDPELRIHGIAGLRVVDASIMPKLTTGNTNAPTMMIAERAIECILQPGMRS
jgi:choline dehydrogenase